MTILDYIIRQRFIIITFQIDDIIQQFFDFQSEANDVEKETFIESYHYIVQKKSGNLNT